MKRVGCLYRVSTLKQVYKNDIPVQRTACKKFIKTKADWKFEKDYMELGVSGYKLKESERDVLQDIKRDVIDKKIDILLVFMFDRIGRREEETPFVVEWLIKQGIEVWSVNEGQRKIENRADKLINYLTYWQAEGESEKISLRATERRIQLVKDGIYMGNYPPYGYKLVNSNEYTKIGKVRRILKIYPKEAEIIKLIFDLIIDKDYGIDKIAISLNTKKIPRRKKGIKWDNGMVLWIVRNPIYKGYVSFGKANRKKHSNTKNSRDKWILSEKANEDIVIIPEERWNKANEIIDSRSRKGERVIRLLSGLTKCGYCKESIVPKGKSKYIYMICKGKQKTGTCQYSANYRIDRLEKIVSEEIENYLTTFKKINLKDEIRTRMEKENNKKEKLGKLERKIKNTKNKLDELKKEVVLALTSQDESIKEELGNQLKNLNKELDELIKEKDKIEDEIYEANIEINKLEKYIPEWEQEFKDAPLEVKRIILNEMVDKIVLFNDKVEVCISYPISNLIVKEI